MVPEILADDLRLRDSSLAGQLGRDDREKAGLLRQPQAHRRALRREQPDELREDPLAGDVGSERSLGSDRLAGRGLRGEPQRGGEADRPQHPQRVLAEAGSRDAHRSKQAGPKVVQAAEPIDDGARLPVGPQRDRAGRSP